LHARPLTSPIRRAVWIHRVHAPALVLGSRQGEEVVARNAAAAAEVEVVRRRSGGGAVLLRPGASLWVDLVVPAGDVLWDDDVVRAATWVGRAWAGALVQQGVSAVVHEGRLAAGAWGEVVCFAGVGPGEVLVGGRKVVGLSQRRTRGGARFQCVVDPTWDAGDLLRLLDLPEEHRAAASAASAPAAGWVAPAVDLSRLERDLLALLPD
jgi:lipoate-protein ligase A